MSKKENSEKAKYELQRFLQKGETEEDYPKHHKHIENLLVLRELKDKFGYDLDDYFFWFNLGFPWRIGWNEKPARPRPDIQVFNRRLVPDVLFDVKSRDPKGDGRIPGCKLEMIVEIKNEQARRLNIYEKLTEGYDCNYQLFTEFGDLTPCQFCSEGKKGIYVPGNKIGDDYCYWLEHIYAGTKRMDTALAILEIQAGFRKPE